MNLADVSKLLVEASSDEFLRLSLDRANLSYWELRKGVFTKYPYLRELADSVRRAKEISLSRMEELTQIAMESVERNGGVAYLARTPEEAKSIVNDIVGNGRVVVKGKSIVSEEVKLRESLIERGKEVYETDLGEFLVQFIGPKSMHFITVSIHLTREKVAEFLRGFLRTDVDKDDIEGMVALVRGFLRRKYFEADVGMSGANVLAADDGFAFIIENESNVRLSTSLPRKHIVLVGMEKVVPTMEDAWRVVEIITRYSGYKVSSYVNIVRGPQRGGVGPEEFHVVFLDNGRVESSRDPLLSEALLCLRCGACQYLCPIFWLVGGYWGGLKSVYSGGIGVIWEYITGSKEEAEKHSFACLLCGRCKEACPMRIDQARILRGIRSRAIGGSQRSLSNLVKSIPK
ncbi:MAG: LUD domain-containing protein [Candidatus Korarchaeum sp.]|nr:LUD domain-containing protein [Candidatus Korarchaeum sp.]MDW8035153.1 LUD domain-containing protein [Candidatus Korarchaeum sp.]